MYYPILRGRQNELIALRELATKGCLDQIIPVIEPVKATPTLLRTLERLIEEKNVFAVVMNPVVGTFSEELSQNKTYKTEYDGILANEQAISFFYPTNDTSILPDDESRKIAFYLDNESLGQYRSMIKVRQPDTTFLPTGSSRLRRLAKGQTVSIDSSFEAQKRNIDYRNHREDFLTEEHLFAQGEGNAGYADYSIVGREYNIGGFMPQVVALHLPFFKKSDPEEDNGEQVWIRHFTSDTHDEEGRPFQDKDVAGKFHSALKNMITWLDETNDSRLETYGVEQFRELFSGEKYPGLGAAKKLSIAHHLEMMNSFENASRG